MLKLFNVSDLQPGMLVSKVVSQHGPVKIRKVGMIRSPEMIKGLANMGVTEVEVDLSQSLGLLDTEGVELDVEPTEQAVKLTPTQQLLQNERKSAKANNDVSQQYHRSLFMPSMDTLPSSWDLYGKNISLLLLLVVGGLCVGWNIASIPDWLSLTTSKDYMVIDYQPANSPTQKNLALNANSPASSLLATELSNEQNSTNDANTVTEDMPASAAPEAKNSAGLAQVPTPVTPKQKDPGSVPEAEPLVLGYLPENMPNTEILERSAVSEGESILNLPANTQSESAVSARLLAKINKAIAELDKGESAESNFQQSTSFDDLPRVDQLSVATQTQIPTMAFSAHMYSSERPERWVRVNGRRLVEGDFIAENLQLVNIEPQKVILSFKDEVFTMNALSDW
ncbi:MAG: general secretion pathway protein B [Gammaproteobacteria bacterium]|jgi:general secretion pathway protein B